MAVAGCVEPAFHRAQGKRAGAAIAIGQGCAQFVDIGLHHVANAVLEALAAAEAAQGHFVQRLFLAPP